jgi:hypothetical protein
MVWILSLQIGGPNCDESNILVGVVVVWLGGGDID